MTLSSCLRKTNEWQKGLRSNPTQECRRENRLNDHHIDKRNTTQTSAIKPD